MYVCVEKERERDIYIYIQNLSKSNMYKCVFWVYESSNTENIGFDKKKLKKKKPEQTKKTN